MAAASLSTHLGESNPMVIRFKKALDIDGGHAAGSGGRDGLAILCVMDIARGEYAGDARRRPP